MKSSLEKPTNLRRPLDAIRAPLAEGPPEEGREGEGQGGHREREYDRTGGHTELSDTPEKKGEKMEKGM